VNGHTTHRFESAPDRSSRPRRHFCCGPERSGYRLSSEGRRFESCPRSRPR